MTTNNKPANTLRSGNIKATIWQNVSEKGPFFATTFSRPFNLKTAVEVVENEHSRYMSTI